MHTVPSWLQQPRRRGSVCDGVPRWRRWHRRRSTGRVGRTGCTHMDNMGLVLIACAPPDQPQRPGPEAASGRRRAGSVVVWRAGCPRIGAANPGVATQGAFIHRGGGVFVFPFDSLLPGCFYVRLHLRHAVLDVSHQVLALPVEAQVHPVVQAGLDHRQGDEVLVDEPDDGPDVVAEGDDEGEADYPG